MVEYFSSEMKLTESRLIRPSLMDSAFRNTTPSGTNSLRFGYLAERSPSISRTDESLIFFCDQPEIVMGLSLVKQHCNIVRYPLFQFSRLDVQRFEFFVQLFKAHVKFKVVRRPFSHTHVAARIE